MDKNSLILFELYTDVSKINDEYEKGIHITHGLMLSLY